MSGSAHVCVAESDYGLVLILVAGTIGIGLRLVFAVHVVGNGVGVRTELHNAEGNAGSGEGVPHSVCSNHWVHILHLRNCLHGECSCE